MKHEIASFKVQRLLAPDRQWLYLFRVVKLNPFVQDESTVMASSLKLLAMDPDDLIVVSAHVQDSVLRSCEIEYDPARKLLFLPINRFAWEAPGTRKRLFKSYERRRSVLHFAQIASIRSSGVDRKDETQVKSILSIEFQPNDIEDDPGGVIQVNFAGGGALHLTVECIEAQLTDMGAAWSASSKPKHNQ